VSSTRIRGLSVMICRFRRTARSRS
jgi:hypothetical protein